ncbi:MAG: membrane protein insertase YidC [Thermoflavifilum sp.]|uniref:membrane protein insertase YidC n=1 Tax=Thermoflavifilum sp. TaxID=1968839 RepID=UPI0018A589E7|nr:membrane protein insertase YidC [Thermoflavifilum sp.]QOR76102.1 MAG: membrane protein insertase YidC [Thermoflavifilum sp.]
MMDRNSVIGFILLSLLVVGYLYYNQQAQEKYLRFKAQQDSLAKARTMLAADSLLRPVDTARITGDSLSGAFPVTQSREVERFDTIDNGVLQIVFTNKGGIPHEVILKNYQTYSGKPLLLKGNPYDQLSLLIPATRALPLHTAELYFQLDTIQQLADHSYRLQYRLPLGSSHQYLEYDYLIHPHDYRINWQIQLVGMDQFIPAADQQIQLLWQTQANHQERDITIERRDLQLYFRTSSGGHTDIDYFSFIKTQQKNFDKSLQWISLREEFFNVSVINTSGTFTGGSVQAQLPEDDPQIVGRMQALLTLPYTHQPQNTYNLQLLYGPNDYALLKSYHIGIENIIPLGYGIYAFVKYINKWIILPVFLLLGKWIGNWGIVIVLLTIVIRLLISPLTYKSYLSQAKMKVLKPELDELRKKYKDDQQKFAMEQMKLFRMAGVSPLGGCIPALLQIPIFFALYSLFMSAIQLRQQHFLWVKDLSTYDSILNLPFKIPLYGDHVSLLTLLMTLTSLVMAFYNKNNMAAAGNTGGQEMAFMKYMPFILPVFFLGFFNSLAAGLTLYYLVSNIITILIQLVIQHYIIDEEKIHRQIQENKKKPLKASRWQQRLEEIQKAQTAAQQRNRAGR